MEVLEITSIVVIAFTMISWIWLVIVHSRVNKVKESVYNQLHTKFSSEIQENKEDIETICDHLKVKIQKEQIVKKTVVRNEG